MSSSSDSGRFNGQRSARALEKSSNFSQTCSLLSQYLKEKGTFGDLSLGMRRGFEANGVPSTPFTTMNLFPLANKSEEASANPTRPVAPMDLFPQQSGFGSDFSKEDLPKKVDSISSATKTDPATAQMTIFYGGQVIVFNDFPADKAKEIMFLASKGSSHNTSRVQKPIEPTNLIPTISTTGFPNLGNNTVPERVEHSSQPIFTDLRIARKASLSRFFGRRKDRITARAPYQTTISTASPLK